MGKNKILPTEEALLSQAVAYFRKYPVYGKLFRLMKQKYASLGRLGGTFMLEALTPGERDVLSGFTGLDFGKCKAVRLPYAKLEHALEKSRFGGLSWEAILGQYYGAPLPIQKELRQRQQAAKESFWNSCLAECKNQDVKAWLSGILLEQKQGYRLIEKQYKTDAEGLRQMLGTLSSALGNLPIHSGQRQLLPVFAAQTAGNPHYFDEGRPACSLLLNYGASRFGQADTALSGIEQRESTLYQMGILKDGLSNLCLAYGILGRKKDGGMHEGLLGFSKEKQALPLTLDTLGSLSQLVSAEAWMHQGNAAQAQNIYVLENPAVFTYLARKYPTHAFLCTMGQLRLASYAAMDLFPEGYAFSYAGDFDPEGLQIAQGLKKRYGSRLILWNYQAGYYMQAAMDPALSPARMKKLENIQIPELQEIKECLLTHKKPAYQERMLEAYAIY